MSEPKGSACLSSGAVPETSPELSDASNVEAIEAVIKTPPPSDPPTFSTDDIGAASDAASPSPGHLAAASSLFTPPGESETDGSTAPPFGVVSPSRSIAPPDGSFEVVTLDVTSFPWSADLRMANPVAILTYLKSSGRWAPHTFVTESPLLRHVHPPVPPSLGLFAARPFHRPRESKGLTYRLLLDTIGFEQGAPASEG